METNTESHPLSADKGFAEDKAKDKLEAVTIDAGIEHINIEIEELVEGQRSRIRKLIPTTGDLETLFKEHGIFDLLKRDQPEKPDIYITGKLGEIVKRTLGRGENIMPAAAIWSAAKDLINQPENKEADSLGIIDLSASGYTVIAVDKEGNLKNDLLVVNPHCGAGSGINLSRAMQKLNIERDEVDEILKDYLGEKGKVERQKITERTDRCGVFSSSATVSDKNQGIPLDRALAVTLKSEVLKACRKLSCSVDKVYLTGRIFKWQYARDCAEDELRTIGVKEVKYDDEQQSFLINGTKSLVERVGKDNFREENPIKLRKKETFLEYPSFSVLKGEFEREGLYKRHPDTDVPEISPEIEKIPVNIALDIGSTMAKMVISDAKTGQILFYNSYFNHGDTIETLKHIFRDLQESKIQKLNIQNIGITGSGRYQVQKVLRAIYPHLKDRVEVLVENYAHARGSIEEARERIEELKAQGQEVNEDYCLVVDVGGEDTKISIISLKEEDGDLVDNAMNLKCSAGTGSLMDTLRTLFAIENIEEACQKAFEAPKAYGINATCAVFLMENARKMQAQGYKKDEILASCYWAIVENMARTLWTQVEFPKNTVALLHGQTMLSDPLPLAVVHRLQECTGSKMYGLAPSFPGHRACIGLIKNMEEEKPNINKNCNLSDLINCEFEKNIFTCHGVVCGGGSCNRTALTFISGGKKEKIALGGCTAINDMASKKKESVKVPDTYKEIWKFIESKMPKSKESNRLVIPRSFAISEQAFFLAEMFKDLGIPVHVDSVNTLDVLRGQPKFNIDTCAPNIGSTGQFMRLAKDKHGMILVPQVEYLSTEHMSLGKTCTSNQGGPMIAMHFAKMENPEANFYPFDISLENLDPVYIANQLYDQLQPIFEQYNLKISKNDLISAIKHALKENEELKNEITENVADYLEKAIEDGANVAIACGREYILNPGVYDSHVGKLAREKGMVTIPSYVLDVVLSEEFGYMYWRNPHHILTIVNAVKNKELHTIIKNERLKKLIERIEKKDKTDSKLGIMLVSTFRCGPDSVTLPTIQELTKSIPFLVIQSDAAINELAHLENRVNTWLKQLTEGVQREAREKNGEDFTVEALDRFEIDKLDKETDVVYFPTMADNRFATASLKAAGFTCIENYDDETYDFEKLVKFGRKYTGDSVCAPLSAVFADTLLAIKDFMRRKEENDPLVKGKTRVIVFNNKGAGPCRQGQYYEIHRLFLHRISKDSSFETGGPSLDKIMKFLVGLEKDDFDLGVEEWVMVQAFQAAILKGVLESIFLKGGANCRNHQEYQEFLKDYRELKQKVYETQEKNAKPTSGQKAIGRFAGKGFETAKSFRELVRNVYTTVEKNAKPIKYFREFAQKVYKALETTPLRKALKLAGKGLEQIKLEKFEGIDKYIEYGLYNNNGLREIFREFRKKWIHPNGVQKNDNKKLKIYADGEIYMRVAQIEEVFKELIDAIGFGSFEFSYSPMWAYFDYMCESKILVNKREIEVSRGILKDIHDPKEREQIENLIKEKEELISKRQKTKGHLRNRLAKPLYEAAGIEMPYDMKDVLEEAKQILPRLKPLGELAPYVGEAIMKLKAGADLFINIAPDGCMVASMGDILTEAIMEATKTSRKIRSRMLGLFSQDGEIDRDSLRLALLKILGPEAYYKAA